MNNITKFAFKRGAYLIFVFAVLGGLIFLQVGMDNPIDEMFFLRLSVPVAILLSASVVNSVSFYIALFKNKEKTDKPYIYFKCLSPRALKIVSICLVVISAVLFYASLPAVISEIVNSEEMYKDNIVTEFVYTDNDNTQSVLKADTDINDDKVWLYTVYGTEGGLHLNLQNGNEVEGHFEYLYGVPSFLKEKYIEYYYNDLGDYLTNRSEIKSITEGDTEIKYCVSEEDGIDMLMFNDKAVWHGRLIIRNDEIDAEDALDLCTEYFKANIEKGLNYAE